MRLSARLAAAAALFFPLATLAAFVSPTFAVTPNCFAQQSWVVTDIGTVHIIIRCPGLETCPSGQGTCKEDTVAGQKLCDCNQNGQDDEARCDGKWSYSNGQLYPVCEGSCATNACEQQPLSEQQGDGVKLCDCTEVLPPIE